MSNSMSYRSRVADHIYNETEYQEGQGTEVVVSKIERIAQSGRLQTTVDELTAIVEDENPELIEKLKSIRGRVKRVISWAASEGFLERNGDVVVIKLAN